MFWQREEDLTAQIYTKLFALTLLLVFGQAMQRRLKLPDAFYESVNTLLIRVTLPAMILVSMDQVFSYAMLQNSLQLLLTACGVFASVILALEIWKRCSRLPKKTLGLYQYLILVGNTAFMGYPVVQAIYGSEGVFYASVCNLVHNLITFSYAISLLECGAEVNRRHRRCSACLLASIVGILLFLVPFQLPDAVHQTLDWLGSITIPLCLVCTGARLSGKSIRRAIRSGAVWAVSFTRLVLFPLLLIPVLLMLHCRGVTLVVPVVLFATPAALTAGAFAQQYGCDTDFAANTVVFSNVLSLLTLPAIVALLHLLTAQNG